MTAGGNAQTLAAGVVCALGAGLVWGLVFVAPLMLADYPAAALSIGRYLAFGLIALPLAVLQRRSLARLTRADWLEALCLALVGNLIYYASLAAAIQLAHPHHRHPPARNQRGLKSGHARAALAIIESGARTDRSGTTLRAPA
jgi:hypothetical protein